MNHNNEKNITYPPTEKTPESVRDYVFELVILILGITAIINVTLLKIFPLPKQILVILYLFDSFLAITFLIDFLRNIYFATSRLDYLKWGWIDLFSGIPFFPLLRYAHFRRIVQGIQLLRTTSPREILKQYRLRRIESLFLGSILVSIFVILFASILILHIESEVPDGNIETGEDALWWALVTISTVGYGDLYPVTSYGRFLASIVIFFGVALFGMITSYITSRFLNRPNNTQEISEMKDELTIIRETVDRLEERLVNNQVANDLLSKNKDG
jgi:voltage-gated potassium channel